MARQRAQQPATFSTESAQKRVMLRGARMTGTVGYYALKL
jgi:hypothetical protein